MKLKALFILLFVAVTVFAIDFTTPVNITLSWSDMSQGQCDIFKVYQSVSLNVPLTNWTLLTTIAGNQTTITLNMLPGKMFFYVTGSNLWGESGPSNITNTPPIPGATNIAVHR